MDEHRLTRIKKLQKQTKRTKGDLSSRQRHPVIKVFSSWFNYAHQFVDHAVLYARGHIHTNGLENFWSLLKCTWKGTYVHCEPFHPFPYLDEQSYRFNERIKNDCERFVGAIKGISGRRLTYAQLTGKQ